MADFAAAQRRIQLRRAAREEALSSERLQLQQERATQLTRLSPRLRTFALSSQNLFDRILTPFGTSPAFRVGQVDAELLDEALLDLLKKQAGEGLKLYGAHLKDDWEAEILLLLRSILWKLSIWDHSASYGASLQGLKYIDARGREAVTTAAGKEASKWQRALYGMITVGGRYGWSRWEEYLSNKEGGYDEPSPLIRRVSRLSSLLTSAHSIASFLSFSVFLYDGHYRTLTDRILRLRLVPTSNQTSREVSFEFLNRQLVWHAFTEFLLFLLPLVGITRWKRWLSRAWKKLTTTVTRLRTGGIAHSAEDDEDEPGGELAFLPERTCAICYQDQNPTGGQSEQDVLAASASAGANAGIAGNASTDITNPYAASPCGCIYCFVCLAQRIEGEEGEGWVCLRCGEIVKECAPWSGDILLTSSRDQRRRSTATSLHSRKGSEDARSVVSSEHAKPRRRKSVMFDLSDDESSAKDGRRSSDGSNLSKMDPMPMEDGMDWSRVDGEDDEAIESDEET